MWPRLLICVWQTAAVLSLQALKLLPLYALALYNTTKLIFTGVVAWVMAAAAARRFSGE